MKSWLEELRRIIADSNTALSDEASKAYQGEIKGSGKAITCDNCGRLLYAMD